MTPVVSESARRGEGRQGQVERERERDLSTGSTLNNIPLWPSVRSFFHLDNCGRGGKRRITIEMGN